MSQHPTPSPTNDQYFSWVRHDILALVPDGTHKVLSIGCGAGATEEQLVRRGIQVTGIELNPEAAAKAREKGIDIHAGDVEAVNQPFEPESFDCLIYADVLEHLKNPEKILENHLRYLRPGGTVLISVPNFCHYTVIWALLVKHEFTYREAGIFDRTHLRITTLKNVIQWVAGLGLQVTQHQFIIHSRRYRLINQLTLGLFKHLLASQVIVAARK